MQSSMFTVDRLYKSKETLFLNGLHVLATGYLDEQIKKRQSIVLSMSGLLTVLSIFLALDPFVATCTTSCLQ